MKNKIHWDEVDNSLIAGNLLFNFDGAEGGVFSIINGPDEMILLKYEQAKEFIRFVRFAEGKK